jgi:hypothetical protein
MKAASLNELKKELQELEPSRLAELCVDLAKYKKDNKEFLGYLLFESHDKPAFIKEIKELTDTHFAELATQTNLYYTKKSLRKILRIVNKYIKYLGDKPSAIDLLLYFCMKMKQSGIDMSKSVQITNIYTQQVKKINGHIETLHPDLQYDYLKELENLDD